MREGEGWDFGKKWPSLQKPLEEGWCGRVKNSKNLRTTPCACSSSKAGTSQRLSSRFECVVPCPSTSCWSEPVVDVARQRNASRGPLTAPPSGHRQRPSAPPSNKIMDSIPWKYPRHTIRIPRDNTPGFSTQIHILSSNIVNNLGLSRQISNKSWHNHDLM